MNCAHSLPVPTEGTRLSLLSRECKDLTIIVIIITSIMRQGFNSWVLRNCLCTYTDSYTAVIKSAGAILLSVKLCHCMIQKVKLDLTILRWEGFILSGELEEYSSKTAVTLIWKLLIMSTSVATLSYPSPRTQQHSSVHSNSFMQSSTIACTMNLIIFIKRCTGRRWKKRKFN